MGRPVLGSLCTGFGGLDLAVAALLDVQHAWHAETDSAASTVLAAHWPGVPNLGDITTVDWASAEPVDVLTAGFPCQPASVAGKRRGTADERWLWPDVARAVAALTPALVVLENVPALMTMEAGEPFGGILADLADLGYASGWTTVGACKVGACHHRHRMFLAAVPAELVPEHSWPLSPPSWCRSIPGRWQPAADALFDHAGPVDWPPAGLIVEGRGWPLPADVCGVPVVRAPRPAEEFGQDGLFDLAVAGVTTPLLPTPTAIAYGSNQSPSDGAVVRPSLEGVLRMLPSPKARDADGRGSPNPATAARRIHDEGRRNLDDAVALLPTPTARDGMSGPGHADTAEGSPDLRTVVSTLLPTPTARDAHRGAGRTFVEGRPLSEVVALLPTPVAADARGTRNATAGRNTDPAGPHTNHSGWTLGDVIHAGRLGEALLPTPVATDADGSAGRRNTHGKPMLPGAVTMMMPTPRASDADKGGPGARGSKGDPQLPAAVQPGRFGMYEAAVRRQELAFGYPAPEPTEPGRLGQPRLAAAFPEWMLGLPPGWITDHVGRNDAIRIAGNGVCIAQGALALTLLPTFAAYLAAITGEPIEVNTHAA